MTIIICRNKPQTENVAWRPLEWIESVDDVIPGRDVLRIWGFRKDSLLEGRLSKRAIEFFGSDQIIFWYLDRQRWTEILNTRCATHRPLWFVFLSSCCQGLKPEIYQPVRIRNDRVGLYLYHCYNRQIDTTDVRCGARWLAMSFKKKKLKKKT